MPTLQFKGRNIIWNHHLSVPYHALESAPELDFQPDKANGNLIIEGDNLLALKALLPHYAGKIKCIYIDPPYNTGNEGWIYNDKVNSPLMREWLGKVVAKDDLTRHDKWLCMMVPRLRLLRDLLSNNGCIFISIDDVEVHHLRALTNEVFGEDNFIGLLPTVMNLKGNQDEFGFAGTHEYTLVYAREKESCELYEFEIDEEELLEWEEDDDGYFKKGAGLTATGGNAPRAKRPNLFYPILIDVKNEKIKVIPKDEYDRIYDSSTKSFDDDYLESLKGKYEKEGYTFLLPITNNEYASWRWKRETVEREPHNLILVKNNGGDYGIHKKQRPSIGDIPTKKPKSFLYKPEYSSGNGTRELRDLFGSKVFDNPKPLELLKDIARIGSRPGDTILDSFAGSGTLGQAVIELNEETEEHRNFILVQMTESTRDEPGKNVCLEITRERVKRAIEKYGYEGGFEYMRVGQSMDGESLLAGQLPAVEPFAQYVFYLCTGDKAAVKPKEIEKNLFLIGSTGNANVYMAYADDYDTLTRLALNTTLAEAVTAQQAAKHIVYAPACFLDEDTLRAKNIEFVSIPYGLFQRDSNGA